METLSNESKPLPPAATEDVWASLGPVVMQERVGGNLLMSVELTAASLGALLSANQVRANEGDQ